MVHVVYAPIDMQPADPVSRAQIHQVGGIESAVRAAKVRWSITISELHQLECKGVSYVSEKCFSARYLIVCGGFLVGLAVLIT